ncbi:Gly-X carboxypeptidase [Scheffersomyces xylosifermentans]|uniref:Gly-X carboxypeptidase n=1 Tax=Scheffersomyces xylosifermentans TaxID=1304137 RepID=UPI00315C73C7
MVRLTEDNEVVSWYKEKFEAHKKLIAGVVGGIVVVALILSTTNLLSIILLLAESTDRKDLCPIHNKISPQSFQFDNTTVFDILNGESFRLQSVQKLSGAVQVDTQIGDNQPDVEDAPELWAKFKDFHKYLEETFPVIYANLKVEYVNTYGLVYTWKGSNKALKPLLLTAHQDVVPVQKDTIKDWTYPPFEGHYDGKFIYGRGSSDCKNVLIAILETIELLINKGVEPHRTVIAAFGFDEEASGIRGAYNIGQFLEKKLGKDSIYAILDEGPGLMPDPLSGLIIAAPATGEKGYIDIVAELTTPGGHSSIPPDHTSIGIMGELAYIIEKDQYSPLLTTKNPVLNYLQCLAVNSNALSTLAKKAILRAGFDKFANSKVVKQLSQNPLSKYLIKTSQAIDIIEGGEKANALPENVKLVVNHRVAVETPLKDIREHFTNRVIEVAKRHDLGVVSFGKTVLNGTSGHFELREQQGLETAPVSPANDTVWKYIAGTTRHVFEDLVFTNKTEPIIVSPVLMPANTDTRHYWDLTRNIYRYSPFFSPDDISESHIHSVDEKVRVDGHLQLIAFFYEYIQNVDTAFADN